jgi:tetratricopeptide (TPR) repeat protein
MHPGGSFELKGETMKTTRRLAPLTAMFAVLAAQACAHGPRPLNARAVALQAEGAEALSRGELDRAAGRFALALDYEPRFAEAQNGLGLVALQYGDWARAEDRFRDALALDENLAEAHLNLGHLLLRKDSTEDALGEFRAALAVDPGYGDARLAAGQALLRLGRPVDARWELAKLCAAEPERADAHAAHALALAAQGRLALAEGEARAALELDARLPMAHRARAEILRRGGDFTGAAAELATAIGKGPGEVDDRISLVAVLAARGLWDDVDRQLAGLVEAAPRRAEVRFLVAYAALARERFDAAAAAAGQALALRAPYPEARLVLAEALARDGQQAEARKAVEAFLREAPAEMADERSRAEAFLKRP